MLKFSVLMSVYKKEKAEYFKQALDSVLSQTLQPSEIVIVQDGQLTDELDALICDYTQKYEKLIRIIPFSKNRGMGPALRDGVIACQYDYIARMDTDDIACVNRFEQQIEYLQQHPEIDILGSWITEFSKNQQYPDTLTKLPCNNEEVLKFAKKRNPFRHMTVIVRKKAVLDSGNYRDFLWFEDYDLWVRMLIRGCKGANLPLCLVNVRATNAMFNRRGGWQYLKQDLKFQKFLLDMEFITIKEFSINLTIRTIVRIVPNALRILIYKKLLRN